MTLAIHLYFCRFSYKSSLAFPSKTPQLHQQLGIKINGSLTFYLPRKNCRSNQFNGSMFSHLNCRRIMQIKNNDGGKSKEIKRKKNSMKHMKREQRCEIYQNSFSTRRFWLDQFPSPTCTWAITWRGSCTIHHHHPTFLLLLAAKSASP